MMKYTYRFKRHGFTLLEMVFVIIVLGILASLAVPRIDRDLKQEAADNILSDIRYTQHLAQMGSKQMFNDPRWERRYWRIVFGSCTGNDKFYMIGTDDDMDGSNNAYFENTEAAIDPSNGKYMFWTNGNDCSNGGDNNASSRIFISKKYSIKNVTSSGGCANATHIGFDHLGRPQHGVGFSNANLPEHKGYMSSTCTFTFTLEDDSTFSIAIEPETGYAYISSQLGS